MALPASPEITPRPRDVRRSSLRPDVTTVKPSQPAETTRYEVVGRNCSLGCRAAQAVGSRPPCCGRDGTTDVIPRNMLRRQGKSFLG